MRTSALALATLLVTGLSASPAPAQTAFSGNTITRIGVVVADVEKASKTWADVFGVTVSAPKDVKPSGFPGSYMGDKAAYTRAAEARFKNIIVELAQPMGGKSPWRDHLDAKGQGVHHVAFTVADVEADVRFLESKGGVRVAGAPGSGSALVDLGSRIGISLALTQGTTQPDYVVKRRPDARASGGFQTVARLGLLGADTDSRRAAFMEIFGKTIPDPTNETGLTFPKGFTGDPKSGMRHIFVPFDNLWINVIQPLGGDSPWRDMVTRHQHYLFFAVEDVQAVTGTLVQQGGTRTLGAEGGAVAYVDMRAPLGITVFLLRNGILPE